MKSKNLLAGLGTLVCRSTVSALWLGLLCLGAGSAFAQTGWPNSMRDSDDELGFQIGAQSATGVSQWFVSEPYLNLWIYNQPLTYYTSWGEAVPFAMAYKQRGSIPTIPSSWEHSYYTYVEYYWDSTWPGHYKATGSVYVPLGGMRVYVPDGVTKEPKTGSTLQLKPGTDYPNSPVFVITYPDGRVVEYGNAWLDGSHAWINTETDAAGRTTYYTWQLSTGGYYNQLTVRSDWDGATLNFEYANASQPWQVTKVYDSHSYAAYFYYDSHSPYNLTSIVNVAGMTSTFSYDSQSLITNMVTVYGTNSFKTTTNSWGAVNLGGTNQVNRSVEITEANGDKHLFLYRDLASKLNAGSSTDLLASSYATNQVPTTGALPNTFENVGLDTRNTFHWSAKQYSGLSSGYRSSGDFNQLTVNDYKLAQIRHWLRGYTNEAVVSSSLSLSRDASPDGTTEGQKYWFDYAGKATNAWTRGTNAQPSFVAFVLPDTTSRYVSIDRSNRWEKPTRQIESCTISGSLATRTNTFTYSSDDFDVIEYRGPYSLLISSNAYWGHNVITNYNALSQRTLFGYNPQAQVTWVLRPSGAMTTNDWNTTNSWYGSGKGLNMTRDYDSGTSVYFRTNQFFWDRDILNSGIDPRGTTNSYGWDTIRRMTDQTTLSGTANYQYTSLDLTNFMSAGGMNSSKFVYDAMQQLRVSYDSKSNPSQLNYAQGLVVSITNALGQTNGFTYDNNGHLLSTIYHDKSAATNTYDLLGRVTKQADAAGHWVSKSYNNQGLVSAISNYYGRVMVYTYDPYDRVTNMVDANGVSTSMTYDNLGRLLTRSVSGGGTELFEYGLTGLITYTNQLGKVTHYGNDVLGRRIAETNANNEVTRYVYSPAGDLLALIDGKGHSNQWKYDFAGRVTNHVDAAGTEIERFYYDNDGRLYWKWTKEKGDLYFWRDGNNNLTNVNFGSGHVINYAFDAVNRMTNMVDDVGTTRLTYTSFGALESEDGPWDNDTITCYYQTNHLRGALSLLQPNAPPWLESYGYDSANRLQSLTSPAGTFNYGYLAAGGLVNNVTLPPGGHITNVFDTLARLTGTSLKNSAETVVNSHVYVLNNGNQRTRQTRLDGSYADYTYDGKGQLLTALGKESGGTTRLHEAYQYAYDAAGNLSSRTNNALVQAFSVDSRDQLTSVSRSGTLTVAGSTSSTATNVTVNGANAALYGDKTFAKDALSITSSYTAVARDSLGRGDTNTVTVNLPSLVSYQYDQNGSLTNDGLRSFTYDQESQLASVTASGSWSTTFTYDGAKRLRIRREYLWQNSAWVETSDTRYVYDGGLVLQERDGNNIPKTTYTRGLDLSGTFDGAGGIGGLLARTDNSILASGSGDPHAYYHSDGNGNVTMLVSSKQLPVAKYLYDPYGNVIAKSGALADANTLRFSSKEYLASSGLSSFGRRFYDPNLQRWLNRDPKGIEGGMNLYAYVSNRPVNSLDAWGLAPQIAVIWIPDNGPATVQYGTPGMGVDTKTLETAFGIFPTVEQTVYPFDFDWHDFSKLQISIDATRKRLLEENRMLGEAVFIPDGGRLDDATIETITAVTLASQALKLAGIAAKTVSGTISGLLPKTAPTSVSTPSAVLATAPSAPVIIQSGKGIATMQINRGIANVVIGYADQPSLLPLAHQIRNQAQAAGASTVSIDTGYVINQDLAINLGVRAQTGQGFLGGSITVTEGGLTPRFLITIPVKGE